MPILLILAFSEYTSTLNSISNGGLNRAIRVESGDDVTGNPSRNGMSSNEKDEIGIYGVKKTLSPERNLPEKLVLKRYA